MSKFRGNNIDFELFGASHAEKIGIVVHGLPANEALDLNELKAFLARRAPGNSIMSTTRKEADEPIFVSGIENEMTNGDVLRVKILNTDAMRSDYVNLHHIPRPGHADFAAWTKYGLDHDMSGGGEFSGRMTAPLCVLGGIAKQILGRKGITVRAVCTRSAEDILAAKERGDSVSGYVNCIIEGVPAGLGDAGTEGLESLLSALVFGIPGAKELIFGHTAELGSKNNDPFAVENGRIVTRGNHHGGILGGISTGMPIEFSVLFKPTPSIAIEQDSVDMDTLEPVRISVKGRHDPCIAVRAAAVVEACAAIAILDIMLTDWAANDLSDCRRRIDRIDFELQQLLEKRMSISREIAAIKAEKGLPTLDEGREKAILARHPGYEDIFREIMSASKRIQEEEKNG